MPGSKCGGQKCPPFFMPPQSRADNNAGGSMPPPSPRNISYTYAAKLHTFRRCRLNVGIGFLFSGDKLLNGISSYLGNSPKGDAWTVVAKGSYRAILHLQNSPLGRKLPALGGVREQGGALIGFLIQRTGNGQRMARGAGHSFQILCRGSENR